MSKIKAETKAENEDGFIWVQCEDPMCTKWRKVQKNLCDNFSQVTWFCHMNPNKAFNSCEIPQEAMNVKKGRTVVFSELECGLLVWAKMSSYPRWPGIISPDPLHEDGDYIIRYADGTNDPKYYHIEFLGKPHSHAWVSARFVEVYNTATTVDIASMKTMSRKRMKEHLQNSLLEAIQLTNITSEARLKHCVYKYIKPTVIEEKEDIVDCEPSKMKKKKTKENSSDDETIEIRSNQPLLLNISGKVVPVYPYKPAPKLESSTAEKENSSRKKQGRPKSQKMSVVNPKVPKVSVLNRKVPKISILNPKVPKNAKLCGIVNPVVRESAAVSNKEDNLKKDSFAETNNTEKAKSVLKDISNKKENTNEKLVYEDNTMLHNNKTATNDEPTFWYLYKSFCNNNNMEVPQHIMWYNKALNLFKFFQKVNYMGGYRQAVSHWKIWRNICWDVIGDKKIDSQFLSLKKAYRQVLLPFEKNQNNGGYSMISTNSFNHLHATINNNLLTSTKSPISNLCSPVIPYSYGGKSDGITTSNHNSNITASTIDFKNEGGVENSNSLLVGVLSNVTHKVVNTVKTDSYLPSSNPDSPLTVLSPFCLPMGTPYSSVSSISGISDIGLDFAINELNSLERQINDVGSIKSQNTQENDISSQLTLFDDEDPMQDWNSKSYEPLTDSQDLEELNDVMGELTDLDDTLLEMTSDILGSFY